MYIPQIRSFWNDPETRRPVCARSKYPKREDFHLPLVLVSVNQLILTYLNVTFSFRAFRCQWILLYDLNAIKNNLESVNEPISSNFNVSFYSDSTPSPKNKGNKDYKKTNLSLHKKFEGLFVSYIPSNFFIKQYNYYCWTIFELDIPRKKLR